MPRNQPRALSAADLAVQNVRHLDLSHHMSKAHVVTVSYVKRNRETGSATGQVAFFSGQPGMDTGSVTIDTTESKGRPTTVNLHNITRITR